MQGTIAMLMAMSGLGCHHKACTPVVVDSCYSSCHSSCYSSCYSACYASPVVAQVVMPASQCYTTTCYSSCYSGGNSCYASACYSAPAKKCGLFGGGLFKHKRHHRAVDTCCNLGVVESCYSSCYSQPVYGSYTVAYPAGQSGMMMANPQGDTPKMMAPAGDAAKTAAPDGSDAAVKTPPDTDKIAKPDEPKADAPKVVPDEPKADAPKADAPKVVPDPPKADAPKADAPKADAPKA